MLDPSRQGGAAPLWICLGNVHRAGRRRCRRGRAPRSLSGMGYRLPATLAEIAEHQRGVITCRQAQGAGLSRDVISARLKSGRWQRLHEGVYLVSLGGPDRQAMLWAAVLRAGPGAMLSHWSAAEVDHLVDQPSPRIHVTIPGSRRATGIHGVTIHVSVLADRARHPSRLPARTRIEETVLDLSDTSESSWDAVGWIATAIGRRLTTQAMLRAAAAERTRLRWRCDIAAVLSPDLAGLHSALEYRYVRNVERPHGLPKARRQSRAQRGSVVEYRDVLYEDYSLAVELDGAVAHPADVRWRDVQRDNAAAAAGLITLRYGYRDVTTRPCQIAQEVAAVLRVRGWLGAPQPCSKACALSHPARAS